MDKLKAMHIAVLIADHGSLSAAAVAHNTSLPSVVRTLAALESHLGVRLFNRTTRRLALTEEGRFYIDQCRAILSGVEDVESALSVGLVEPSGLLTVTAPVQFGQMYVAPAVTRFVQKYDKVRINLMLLDRVVNLVEENIDVGIRIGALEDSSLIAQPLGSVSRVVVASPAYLSQTREPQHPKALLNENCVRFSGGAGPWWSFVEDGKQFTVPVSGNLEFNQVAPAVDACVAGLGFGSFISYQVKEHIERKRLRVVLSDFQTPPRPINVIYPQGRQLPARVRVFIEWIKSEIRPGHVGGDGGTSPDVVQ